MLVISNPRESLGRYRRLQPVRVSKATTVGDIEAMAVKLFPDLSKAIMNALTMQSAAVNLDKIAAALAHGDVSGVIAALGIENFEAAMGSVTSTLQDAAWGAGVATAGNIVRLTGAAFSFDKLNVRLIDWLKSYSLKLIRDINDSTREGVRSYLLAGMTAGAGPRTTAIQIRSVVGLTDKMAGAVARFRKELETFHLRNSADAWGLGNKISRAPGGAQVFKPSADGSPKDGIDERRLRDFRYDGQLKAALNNGKPLTQAQIDKMVAAYARKYRQFRSQMIARTEAIRATNVGVQDAWRQAIEAGKVPEALVRREWIVSPDERTCDFCDSIPGMNPKRGVQFAEPFGTPTGPLFLPPAHPNCRCTVFLRMWEPEQLQAK
ncbi:Phage head morphogenesis domain containing protein [uncultured Caudovirales phage]|uniref:Phage head morphogenesis domain containing protein n=1 Tax=uncultured Caudovirales phage TaxID=2100421 RepID=A0A6J5Q5N8_9CAUD|nr:Phage head morphogenesis domain containing protein [uncultured Caudovirales phage]